MNRQTLGTIASIFGYSFLICVGFQVLVFVLFLGLHDWGYQLHARFFNLSQETFDTTAYQMLGAMKIAGLVLFFTPWVAMKLVQKKLPE